MTDQEIVNGIRDALDTGKSFVGPAGLSVKPMPANEESELDAALSMLARYLDRRLEELKAIAESQIEKIYEQHRKEWEALIAKHGKKACPRCNGMGKSILCGSPAGAFGLRGWLGCPECGGNYADRPGRGYVDAK